MAHRAGHQALQDTADTLVMKEQGKVPKILHQSWKDTKLLPRQVAWRASWIEQNPGWSTILWTDQANRHLVSEHYPWLLEDFDRLIGIHQADMVSEPWSFCASSSRRRRTAAVLVTAFPQIAAATSE